MARYQVAIIQRPEGWKPESPDAVPPEPAGLPSALGEMEDLFAALRQVIDFNQQPERGVDRRWAVVVEPGSLGRRWPESRLCTPLTYKVTAIWRPEGWEPESPLDVPRCLWQAASDAGAGTVPYPLAADTIRGLNQQSMDLAGNMWYVLTAVENEPVSQTVSSDSAGTETTVQVRRLHVVRPESGGHGSCAYCPAHALPCAQSSAPSPPQTLVETRTTGGHPA